MLALDVETTGTNYEKHSILSIGALDTEHPENRFYGECRAWEGAHLDEGAFEVNGFTEEAARDKNKQSEADLVRSFLAWTQDLRDKTILGHNPSFDREFIRAGCTRAGENFPFAFRTVDTHTLAYMHMVKAGLTPPFNEEKRHSGLNLDAILRYAGLTDEPKPHNALTGALSAAEVASRLLGGGPLVPEFSAYPVPWS
jgi:DNA polymerase III epsilon subunit-like protein